MATSSPVSAGHQCTRSLFLSVSLFLINNPISLSLFALSLISLAVFLGLISPASLYLLYIHTYIYLYIFFCISFALFFYSLHLSSLSLSLSLAPHFSCPIRSFSPFLCLSFSFLSYLSISLLSVFLSLSFHSSLPHLFLYFSLCHSHSFLTPLSPSITLSLCISINHSRTPLLPSPSIPLAFSVISFS